MFSTHRADGALFIIGKRRSSPAWVPKECGCRCLRGLHPQSPASGEGTKIPVFCRVVKGRFRNFRSTWSGADGGTRSRPSVRHTPSAPPAQTLPLPPFRAKSQFIGRKSLEICNTLPSVASMVVETEGTQVHAWLPKTRPNEPAEPSERQKAATCGTLTCYFS